MLDDIYFSVKVSRQTRIQLLLTTSALADKKDLVSSRCIKGRVVATGYESGWSTIDLVFIRLSIVAIGDILGVKTREVFFFVLEPLFFCSTLFRGSLLSCSFFDLLAGELHRFLYRGQANDRYFHGDCWLPGLSLSCEKRLSPYCVPIFVTSGGIYAKKSAKVIKLALNKCTYTTQTYAFINACYAC